MEFEKRVIRTSYDSDYIKKEACPECGDTGVMVATKNTGIIHINDYEMYSCNCGCLWENKVSYRNILIDIIMKLKGDK